MIAAKYQDLMALFSMVVAMSVTFCAGHALAQTSSPLSLPQPDNVHEPKATKNPSFFRATLPTASGGTPFPESFVLKRPEFAYYRYTLRAASWTSFDGESIECSNPRRYSYRIRLHEGESYSFTYRLGECRHGHGDYAILYTVTDDDDATVARTFNVRLGNPPEPLPPPPPPPPPPVETVPYSLYLIPTLIVHDDMRHRVQVLHLEDAPSPAYEWLLRPVGDQGHSHGDLVEGTLDGPIMMMRTDRLVSLEEPGMAVAGALCILADPDYLRVSHILAQSDGSIHLQDYEPHVWGVVEKDRGCKGAFEDRMPNLMTP